VRSPSVRYGKETIIIIATCMSRAMYSARISDSLFASAFFLESHVTGLDNDMLNAFRTSTGPSLVLGFESK
jgi:hypothetical protein